MAFDDYLRRFYLTQGRRVMDDPQTKGTLSLRERDRERESKILLARARTLRRQSSEVENLLWRQRRIGGLSEVFR
jgi:hypothetical protein